MYRSTVLLSHSPPNETLHQSDIVPAYLTVFNELQPENTIAPMLVTLAGIVTVVILVPLNALELIVFTLDGIAMLVRLLP
jgi:hypothetical protein